MKRTIIIFSVFVLLSFFASCTKPKQKISDSSISSALSSPYDTEISVSYKDISFDARIHKILPGYCDIYFTSPESLKDLAVSFKKDIAEFDYKGFSFSLDPDEISGSAAVSLILKALEKASSAEGLNFSLDGSAVCVCGEISGSRFELRLDPKNYNLFTLSSPENDLYVEFKNFDFVKTE